MNLNRSMARYGLASMVMLAGVAWSLSWAFMAQAGDGALPVGLDEGQWRAVLNPALAALLLALVAWVARDQRPARLAIVVGVGGVLAGNVLAHGVLGRPTPLADAGAVIFIGGATLIIVSFGWLIGHGGARVTGRRWFGIGSGAVTSVAVAVMAIAAPPAASLALVLLIDSLIQGSSRPTPEDERVPSSSAIRPATARGAI